MKDRIRGMFAAFISGFLFSGIEAKEADVEAATVVCFGDSITKRGYPEIMGKALGVKVVNAGVAGHTSAEGLRRIRKDVLDLHPDVVVIFFGTNDARVDAPHKFVPAGKYEAVLTEMVKEIEKIDAKVVICTLPPIDEAAYFERHETALYDEAGGTTKLWSGYRAAAMKVAKEQNLPVVDLYTELEKEADWLSPDGVHPSKEGCRIIARMVGEKVEPLLNE
ncbi:SGNH/GDSL hydrolase family protein [Haloferula chungangensis]|uniref:SGNH/GDSL hydrolase family protein n=1 Tax=Haloferula chungangensis TaxID=1048331 RepID=A0ABW2L5U9_9BACT